MSEYGPRSFSEVPVVVDVPDQPCQQLYENHPVLLGYDVVEYHFIPSYEDGGVPVLGKPKYAFNYNGYQFWFSSRDNRNRFINNPSKYTPAFGGFGAWNIVYEIQPMYPWARDFLGPPASPWEGWMIVDGMLLFNVWADYSREFESNLRYNMIIAKSRWTEWFGSLVAGPFNTHCIGHGSLRNWCLPGDKGAGEAPWMKPLSMCPIDPSSSHYGYNNEGYYNTPEASAEFESRFEGGGSLYHGDPYAGSQPSSNYGNPGIAAAESAQYSSFQKINQVGIGVIVGSLLLIGLATFSVYRTLKRRREHAMLQDVNRLVIEVDAEDQEDQGTDQKGLKGSNDLAMHEDDDGIYQRMLSCCTCGDCGRA